MDFFTRQEQSKRVTRWLLVMLALAVLVIVASVTAVVAAVFGLYAQAGGPWFSWAAMHARELVLIAAGTLGFIALASLYRTATLAGGGGQVARMMGGIRVSGDGDDPLHRRLVNVVEEMAIASGLPVPEVYVLEQEPGINAFAAGSSPPDAAIAVTRGALERLERAELQGVVAHEMSHVLNGDMRLNQQLIGLTFGILVLSLIGRWLLRSARHGRRGRNSGGALMVLVIGGALLVIGWVGVLFSRLIKAAVSRQRETLADASAVQFTRDAQGLASALKKIGGYSANLTSVDGEEIAHMLFERGSSAFRGWFATHPPLVERIRALDPTFDPRAQSARGSGSDVPHPEKRPALLDAQEQVRRLAPGGNPSAASEQLLERAGSMESAEVGQALRAALPEELHHAAHSYESSFLLVLALALGAPGKGRSRQLELLARQLGPTRAARCARLRETLDRLDERLRLPLLEITLPTLKQRPGEQIAFLLDLVERLTELDEEERLFEYVLTRLLASYVRALPGAPLRRAPPAELSPGRALASLLAKVAAFGHDDAQAANAAYQAGLRAVGAGVPLPREPSSAGCGDLRELDAALVRLAELPLRAKRRVLAAVLATIRHDRQVRVVEVELFRAIAATLGCPVPPLSVALDSE